MLGLHPGEIDRAAQYSRRSPGLEPLEFDARLKKARGERFGGKVPEAAALVLILADMHQTAQECACGDHHGSTTKLEVEICPHTHHLPASPTVAEDQPGYRRLEKLQIRLQLQGMLQPKLIRLLVALRARRLHGGALRLVEQPKLDSGQIGVYRHLAAQGVDFTHDLPLRLPADGGVARHLRDRIEIPRKQQGARPRSRGGERRLATGMAGTTNNHIEWNFRIGHRRK